MSAEAFVREYYEALRRGEPLYPYFAERDDVVKFGVSEELWGYDAVAEGLREQSRTTDDWTVESRRLTVVERESGHAWFSDLVRLTWTETADGGRHDYETRWSGTLEDDEGWQFAALHVSRATPLTDEGGDATDGDADR